MGEGRSRSGKAEQIGTLTTTTVTTYIEKSCGNPAPHPMHDLGLTGGGGGAVHIGPVHGDIQASFVNTSSWCPGVRGTVRV